MSPKIETVAPWLVIALLVAASAPASAHSGVELEIEKSAPPYDVTFNSWKGLSHQDGGIRVLWEIVDQDSGELHTFQEDLTVDIDWQDDGGSTLDTTSLPADRCEETRGRCVEDWYHADVNIQGQAPDGARNIEWNLNLPNQTVTFSQPLKTAENGGGNGDDGDGNPLPAPGAVLVVAGIAAAAWVLRRRS